MVLLQFLGRLCASATTNHKQKGHGCFPEVSLKTAEPTAVSHDVAVAALHHLISGLTGSFLERIDGLLSALHNLDIIGATYIAFYAVPEGNFEEDELSFVLLGSAHGFAGAEDVCECRSHLPYSQQLAFFKRMSKEKVPILGDLDKGTDTPPRGVPLTSLRQLALPRASALRTTDPQITRVAAVPLIQGKKLAGALWLEQSAASRTAHTPLPPHAHSFLSDLRALMSLGFACSMCILGPEASTAAWLATSVAHLGATDNMSALTTNLCTSLVAHVRRRFVLDAEVMVVLAPHGPEASVGLLLQQVLLRTPINGQTSAVGTGINGIGDIDMSRIEGGGLYCSGGATKLLNRSVSIRGAGGRSPNINVSYAAPQQLVTPPLSGKTQCTEEAGGSSAMASKRGLHIPGAHSNLLRDPTALLQARLSLDLSPHSRQCALDISRSPSVGPLAHSNRSVVIPLYTSHPHATAVASDFGLANAAAAASTSTLHARAFPLHHTLLQARLQAQAQRQQQHVTVLRTLGSTPHPSIHGSNGCGAGAGAGEKAALLATELSMFASPTAAAAVSAVVEDTQLHLQNVHKPSGDICMLMSLSRTNVNDCSTSTSRMAGGRSAQRPRSGRVTPPKGRVMGVPRSLVLVTVPLGGEGKALGLYVCFPKRLPGSLLEAVWGSCQELMDKVLGPVTRARLRDSTIAAEYDTLCSAVPGSYAVMRSTSFSHVPAAVLTATCNSMDLAAAAAATGGYAGVTNTGMTQAELFSSALSTVDVEIMLGLQAQAQGTGGQQQGTAGGGGQDSLATRGWISSNRRSGQERPVISSFRRRGTTIVGAAAAAGRTLLPPSPLSPQSPQLSFRCAVTPFGPAAAVGGTATGGAESTETFNLSQLLRTNPHDILGESSTPAVALGPASHTCSVRSVGGLEQHVSGFAPASIITVSGVDATAMARQQLDLLVSSIHTTLNTEPSAWGSSSSLLDELSSLELGDVLGQGGGGTVFRSRMGTLDVAVKLMEMSKLDAAVDAVPQPKPAEASPLPPQVSAGAANGVCRGGGGYGGEAAAAAVAASKESLNAQREMLRTATELAVQSRVSHPNIVQIYANYNDVVMVPKRGIPGNTGASYRLLPSSFNIGEDGTTHGRRHVPCVAAVFELCDCGSLGGALAARTFPQTIAAGSESLQWDCEMDTGSIPPRSRRLIDIKGVYMTLLDVALALRHLHSLNLVHRDIKPANLLLKSNPRDYRGFTVKLADFGFVLQLTETADDGSRYTIADQACGTVTHMAPEVLLSKAKIDTSVDMYAFGILMWEVFAGGVRPYPQLHPDRIPRAVYRGARPTFKDNVSAAYRKLATACWSTDPQRRPRASDVVVSLNGMLQDL